MMSHMALPLVPCGDQISRSFQGVFAGQENGFVGTVAVFRRRAGDEAPSQDREDKDRQARGCD